MRAHAERRKREIARPPCLASQPEIVDTFAKVRRILRQGFVGRFFYLLIGSRKWMLWENICGRECGELSRTAWTHGLGLQAEGGWVGGGAEGQQANARRGFKKAEPGVWWAEWCMFFPPFPSAPACFSQRGLRDPPTLMRCVQTGHRKHRLVFSSACIVCIISGHCLAKALCN